MAPAFPVEEADTRGRESAMPVARGAVGARETGRGQGGKEHGFWVHTA